jgi:branched-chain amino acid transport system substrate-binding protein
MYGRPVRWVRKSCGLVLGVLAVGACAGSLASAAPAPAPIRIGLLVSLEGAGQVFGPAQVNGAWLAVEQIDQAGGVDGAQLRLVVRDDRSDPATGRRAMRQLIRQEQPIAVLGPTLSAVAYVADPVANRLETPVLGISNTATGIVGACAHPCAWSWRDSLGEAIAVPANISDYVLEAHPSTAAIVQLAGDVLGRQEAGLARGSLRENGVRVVADVRLPATGSVVAGVRRAVARRPAALFVGTVSGSAAAQIIKAARAAGFRGTFLGGNVMNSDATAALAGEAGAGTRSASAWYRDNDFPANSAFVSAYRQRYGVPPDQFATQAYTGVQVVADALRRGRVATSRQPIERQRALLQRALPSVALLSPLGPFRFTADHDVEQIVWILAMDGRGGHRLVGFCNAGC